MIFKKTSRNATDLSQCRWVIIPLCRSLFLVPWQLFCLNISIS